MSQKHLYGEAYTQFNPPQDWQGSGVRATIEDFIDTTETELTTTNFLFKGDAAKFVENEHIPLYGVFQGVRYKVQAVDEFTGETKNIFDGFIDISKREILSRNPIRFRAPIVDFDDNTTIFQQVSVMTQGLLKQQSFLNNSDFADVPVIRESKKNVAERTLILEGLLVDVVGMGVRYVQDFLSGISDVLGISLPVGLVELGLLFANVIIEVNLFVDNILRHKDLFFPNVSYYKAVKFKSVITKAFEKIGKTVDFGEIDSVISKIVLLGSQFENDGSLVPGIPGNGILKSGDWGYRIGEAMETVQTMFNTRQDVRDGVAHIKNKYDPFWLASPEFDPENILLETTEQYSNGIEKENTEEIHGTVYAQYQYDPTDAHTLTAKIGDSHEVRRSLITELDPKLNLLTGFKDLNINYAMAVRKEPFDNLIELFKGITDKFDEKIGDIQSIVNDFLDKIPGALDVSGAIDELLSFGPIGAIIENRTGALKIEDNTFGIPKLIYLDDTGKIPENHKDFIGAPAIYNNHYLKGSPADINGFKGQELLRLGWRIPFTLPDFIKTKSNPYFELDGNDIKFTSITWIEDDRAAVTDAEEQRIFDTNITEHVIEPTE